MTLDQGKKNKKLINKFNLVEQRPCENSNDSRPDKSDDYGRFLRNNIGDK